MKRNHTSNNQKRSAIRRELATPTDLAVTATKDISGAMNAILADVFALYLKTKNFHWHMRRPEFPRLLDTYREIRLLQANHTISAMTRKER